jgi:hypothetical protein
MKGLVPIWIATTCLGCMLFGPGERYGPRDKNCAVKTLPSAPKVPVDDLGVVAVDCWTGDNDGCRAELLDEVCRRGGDVVWGLGDTAPSTSQLAVHAARTRPTASDGSAGRSGQ